MKRFLLLLCLATLLLTACRQGERSAEVILEKLMGDCPSLPAGQVYLHSAVEGLPSYLNGSLRRSLYGEEGEVCFPLLSDFALFLSSRPIPFELAVFLCESATDAHRVAAMCMTRADTLRVALRGSTFEERGEGIRVVVRGRRVIMTVTPDGDAMERLALRLMG